MDAAAEARAREILRGALAQPSPAAASSTAKAGAPKSSPAPIVVVAPKYDLPISQEKWNQLASLTTAYMSDQITPAEYHTKRAEIVGKR
jgi:hypothetical protein